MPPPKTKDVGRCNDLSFYVDDCVERSGGRGTKPTDRREPDGNAAISANANAFLWVTKKKPWSGRRAGPKRLIMNSFAISSIVFACVFGSAVIGLLFRRYLPEHHQNANSQDIVRLAMGLVATMAALVLGLLISSAKSSYDTRSAELTNMSAQIILLDRVLAHYGPQTKEARDVLRDSVVDNLDRVWPQERGRTSEAVAPSSGGEVLLDKIQALSPQDDTQRSLKSQALTMTIGLGQTNWLLFEQGTTSVSKPMLVILVFWLTAIFISFGVFGPRNATVITALFVSGMSVSGAIFLILEMYAPFGGLIEISSAPLRSALTHLGK